MKRIIVLISLISIAVFMCACNREAHVTGLYQWFKYADDEHATYKKSMLVSKNADGTYKILLKDKEVSDSGDNIVFKLDTKVLINSKIKYGRTITVYSNTAFSRCKHQFIFQKNSVKWRYATLESYIENKDFVKENIKHKKYYKLKKYVVD